MKVKRYACIIIIFFFRFTRSFLTIPSIQMKRVAPTHDYNVAAEDVPCQYSVVLQPRSVQLGFWDIEIRSLMKHCSGS